jgi:hypothetical protein
MKKLPHEGIHDLGFTIPGSYSPFYNGQDLSNTEDVVVVTPK